MEVRGKGHQENPSLSSDCRQLYPWRRVRICVLCKHSVRVGAGRRATGEEEDRINLPGPAEDAEQRPRRTQITAQSHAGCPHCLGARGTPGTDRRRRKTSQPSRKDHEPGRGYAV